MVKEDFRFTRSTLSPQRTDLSSLHPMHKSLNFLIALIALILLIAPCLIIASVIFFKDKEKPIYFSKRIGRDNRYFYMPKFRTMRSDAPEIATHLLSKPDDYLLSTGPFLRKYSLDEIPQLYSILRGKMVFVGPRPALYNQLDLIEERNKKGVSILTPGITGWAQVNGRDEISIKEKVKLDEIYLSRRSFFFDIYIIVLTFKSVIKKDGISH